MNRDKKAILYTIGGAAVIASAYIYFKRHKLTTEQKQSQLFNDFAHKKLIEDSTFIDVKIVFMKDKKTLMILKNQFEDEIFQHTNLWKGVEIFFIDSFYYYTEIVSSLIINKINDFLELNPPSIYLFAKILLSNFFKPISFQVQIKDEVKYPEKYIRLIQKQKENNQDLTILEYLLFSYETIDNKSEELICKLFNSLANADEKFTFVLCEKFFRIIGFIARIQQSKNEWIYKRSLHSFVGLVTQNICIQRVFDNLLNTLGANIFNPIEYLTLYIDQKLILYDEDDQIFILLPPLLENFQTFSISSLACLPYFIAKSQKQMFSKSTIQNFFDNNFNFKCEEEKQNFFQCLRNVISKFVLFNFDQLSLAFSSLIQHSFEMQESVLQVIKILHQPSFNFYDFYNLVSSIIILADNNSNATIKK
ncbi:hypothetical protein ABPG74_019939 [Tetrahymena malaccensis]